MGGTVGRQQRKVHLLGIRRGGVLVASVLPAVRRRPRRRPGCPASSRKASSRRECPDRAEPASARVVLLTRGCRHGRPRCPAGSVRSPCGPRRGTPASRSPSPPSARDDSCYVIPVPTRRSRRPSSAVDLDLFDVAMLAHEGCTADGGAPPVIVQYQQADRVRAQPPRDGPGGTGRVLDGVGAMAIDPTPAQRARLSASLTDPAAGRATRPGSPAASSGSGWTAKSRPRSTSASRGSARRRCGRPGSTGPA